MGIVDIKSDVSVDRFFDNSVNYLLSIDKAFENVRSCGIVENGASLSLDELRYFALYVMSYFPEPHIIELGGGRSTLFWLFLLNMRDNFLKLSTFEHDPSFANQLKRYVSCSSYFIDIHLCNLRQVSDAEFNVIFSNPGNAFESWGSFGSVLSLSQAQDTRVKNAFYDMSSCLNFPLESISGLVVDGAHGNGRSLAFPLFSRCLKPDAFVLIDDVDHYPYMDDLSKVFKYRVIKSELPSNGHRWALVRLNGRV